MLETLIGDAARLGGVLGLIGVIIVVLVWTAPRFLALRQKGEDHREERTVEQLWRLYETVRDTLASERAGFRADLNEIRSENSNLRSAVDACQAREHALKLELEQVKAVAEAAKRWIDYRITGGGGDVSGPS